MIYKRFIFLILAGLFLLSTVAAKDDLATPLAPNEVFPDSDFVEVVASLPLYYAEQNQVSFYDDEQAAWISYAYPEYPAFEDESTTNQFRLEADGSFSLHVEYFVSCYEDCPEYDFSPPQAPTVRERYHFDLTTGSFTPFEAICGNYAQALAGQGEWVMSANNEGRYLCNTETGQSSQILKDLPEQFGNALVTASFSPDERYLVFLYPYDLAVFAYDFLENELIALGQIQNDSPWFSTDYPKIEWLDNEILLIENVASNYGGEHYYLFRADIRQSNSVELVHDSHRSWVQRLEDPLRYRWVGNQFSSVVGNELDNTVSEYNPLSNTIETFPYEEDVPQGRLIPDGTNDELIIENTDDAEKPNVIIRFNAATGLREEIASGIFRYLGNFSPNGRYVPVQIDTWDNPNPIAMLDLETNSLLEMQVPPLRRDYVYVYWTDDSQNFMLDGGADYSDFVFRIMSDEIQRFTGNFYPSYYWNDERFILGQSNPQMLEAFVFANNELRIVAQVPENAVMYAVPQDDGTILVVIFHEEYHAEMVGRYLIRLNP